MKQIFSISLIVFTLVSTIGFKWIDHYCAINDSESAMYSSCESEEIDCCATEKQDSKETEKDFGCCETEISVVYHPFHFFESIDQIEFQKYKLSLATFAHETTIHSNYYLASYPSNKFIDLPRPPIVISGKNICIIHQVFRI